MHNEGKRNIRSLKFKGFHEERSGNLTCRQLARDGLYSALTKTNRKYMDADLRMNLLGKEDVWDNLIRVENKQAAAELMEMTDASIVGMKI